MLNVPFLFFFLKKNACTDLCLWLMLCYCVCVFCFLIVVGVLLFGLCLWLIVPLCARVLFGKLFVCLSYGY